jgi:hypothetical protein
VYEVLNATRWRDPEVKEKEEEKERVERGKKWKV